MKQKLKLSTDSLAQIHLDPLKYVSKEEAVKFLRDIVKIPSVTGDEQALGEFIAGFLEDNGIETQVIHTTKRSPNVLGWLRGHGDGPSLMINGHMDTVPVCKGWTYDPYAAKVTDGRLYGHCVRDQKVGVAVQVLTALAVKRSEIPLRGDLCAANVSLHTTSNYTIETHVEKGTATIVKHGVRTDLAAITEPTVLDFQIGIAQRSAYTLRVTTHGKSAHTTSIGKMRGINAVIKMSKVISSLENFKFKPVKLDKSIRSLFDDDRTCFMNIGPIKGGTERNMVPDLCELLLDVRALPGKNVTAVISEIKQRLNKLRAKDRELKVDVENRPTGTIQDAYALSVNHPLVRAASKHLNNVLDIKAELAAENGWTDGSILANEAHIPTIVCGPTGFPIYSPDEYVELDSEYFNGLKFYCSFAIDICGNKKSDFEQKYEPLQSSSKRS